MQRIWVVSELYYPEETSTGYYLTRIAEGLADKFEVRVLCGKPNYSARGVRVPRREKHQKVEIFRARGMTLDKNVILFRIINMLSLSLAIFWQAVWQFRTGDRVLVVTTPPSLPFIVAFACLFKNAKYFLLIHDNYPEILIASEKVKADSLFVRWLNAAHRWLYQRAAKIIVVGRDMHELIARKLGEKTIPIAIIPNWAELEQVEPQPRATNKMLGELSLTDKFVLLYAGNMGYPNDLESIVWCAEKLRDDSRFHFVFLGAGVKKNWLERTVAKKNLVNVSLLSPRPRSEQTNFLNACDVALVSLVAKMWGVSMPSRTYNILAAGKPLIALTEENSELALVIEEDAVGWTVPPAAPEKLLQTIMTAFNARSELNAMGERARRAALEKYSLKQAVKEYLRVFDEPRSRQ